MVLTLKKGNNIMKIQFELVKPNTVKEILLSTVFGALALGLFVGLIYGIITLLEMYFSTQTTVGIIYGTLFVYMSYLIGWYTITTKRDNAEFKKANEEFKQRMAELDVDVEK